MINSEQIKAGLSVAIEAGQAALNRFGDNSTCGFAWATVYVDRTNSAQAKELIKAGFDKGFYPKTLIYWNPSKSPAQSLNVLEAGAKAFAQYLENLGLKATYNSRVD